MPSKPINIQQWTNEIEAFVTETNRQLHELRDLLSMQFADQRGDNLSEAPVRRRAAIASNHECGINQQLAELEQVIAQRLGGGSGPSDNQSQSRNAGE